MKLLRRGALSTLVSKPESRIMVSTNVYVTIALCLIWGLADSIWTGTVLAAWIFQLADDEDGHANSVVGMVEAAMGLSSLFTAIPVGYLADKYGRSPICKVGGIGFLVAVAITVYAIEASVSTHQSLVLLTIAMSVWGVSGGIFNGPMQALFADSIPKGDRSYWYTALMVAYTLPSVIGPLVAILLFRTYGDNWTLDQMKPVFITGLVLEIPAAFLAFALQDKWALLEEEEIPHADCNESMDEEGSVSHICGYKVSKSSIPYILFVGDLLTALGSGMTVKFFPLFFKNEVGLSPSSVQAIYMVVPLAMLACTMLAQKISVSFGRLQTIIAAKTSGIFLLVSLALLEYDHMKNAAIIVPVYVARTAIMNCTYPLDESILMDNVPKETRARWKALESVSAFGWCGSAFLGGVLADNFTYNFAFIITAILQLVGTLVLILLLPIVEEERPAFTASPTAALEDPLLGRNEDDSSLLLLH